MLAKMCGWNEPEKVKVQTTELRVDAALPEQLREGAQQLVARQKHALACVVADTPGTPPREFPVPRRDRAMTNQNQ